MRNLNLSPSVNLGGHRLSVDDLYVLQNGVLDIAKMVAELLGAVPSGGLMVAGGDQLFNDGTEFSINGGWLYYNGALWRVPAVATTPIVPPNTGALYFKLNKEPIGSNVVYQSGAQYQVHVENKALLEWHASNPGGSYIPVSNVSFDNVRAATQQTGWVNVPQADLTIYLRPDNNAAKLTAAQSFYRYKQIGKTMLLHVKATINAPSNTLWAYVPSTQQTTQPRFFAYDTAPVGNIAPVVFVTGGVPYFRVDRPDSTVGEVEFQTFFELD